MHEIKSIEYKTNNEINCIVDIEKYLGDILDNTGTIRQTIEDRK